MVGISAAYTGEKIRNTDGIDYEVIDTAKLDWNSEGVTWGKKRIAGARVAMNSSASARP